MSNSRVKLFFWLLIYPFLFIASQSNKSFSFNDLNVNDGLSQNSVVSITQDSVGYLWFATQDGLNKYQGHSFQYFNKQYQDITRATYAQLGQIYTDNYGDLWSYASNEVIERYNYKTSTFDSISTIKSVTVFSRKNKNELLVGTLNNGVVSINLKSGNISKVFNETIKNLSVFDIQKFGNDLFFGTSNGLYYVNDDSVEFIESTTGFQISSLTQRDKYVIFGTFQNGVHVFDLELRQLIEPAWNIPDNLNVQDIFTDSQNRLWIGTYGNGLFLISENDEHYHFVADKENPYALHYNDILKVFEDNTGNIWFGSDGAGLSYYDEHLVKFNVLTSKQVPEDIHVDVSRAITVDSIGQIWLGTSGKGLTKINRSSDEMATYTTENSGLSSNRIMSLLYDSGSIWIGHQNTGLQLLKSNQVYKNFNNTKGWAIWKIYKDSTNNIWLCTRTNGLVQINKNGKIVKQYVIANSALTTNNIRTIIQDSKGNFWIGTDTDGLFKLDHVSNTLTKIDAIKKGVKSLAISNDKIWIGTNGDGIKSIDITNNEFNEYIYDYDFPNQVIYAIIPDDNGDFWITTNKGISRFSPYHQFKHYVENYTLISGLQAFEFNTGSYYKDQNGIIYFGGIEGINWFKPEDITYNRVLPKTVISKFEVFGDELSMEEGLQFEHNQNTVTFTFSGLHFSHPEKNYYTYKLENHDDDWAPAEYNNVAHYTNLEPNTYTFKVLSSNYEGFWNKNPSTFTFTILKPWYATNLAFFIYLLLVLATIFLIFRYFKFRWEMNTQLQLEHAESMRLKQLDEFKKKLYTNISHEFRTPLTLISGPIDKQLSNEDLNIQEREALELVKQNANRLLGLVNQMMDLSLLDAGQLKLKVKKGNLSIILKQLVAAFRYKSEEKNIHISSSIKELKSVWFDQDIIEKICSNLLINAIKYAPEGTVVLFDANQQNGQLLLSVINENNEVKADKLGKLFERFYQNNEANEGIGVGLALVKDLVTLSKGTILANTIQENKIQFSVTIPISESAFEEFEIVNKTVKTNLSKALISSTPKDAPLLLVAEDDHDILAFVSSIFENDYRILKATDGQKALEICRDKIPDIVISDIMMPELDGIELCNELKQDPLTSHIPIILLTAKVTQEQKQQGLETGADAYVTKPFNAQTLKIRADKLIENRVLLKQRFNDQPILTKALAVTSVEEEFMNRLQSVLDEHITDTSFTSEGFSKLMFMSRTQLHRKLKGTVGMTTSELIRSQRLRLAKELISKHKVTTSEVAYSVGFNSPSYFIKCFKEAFKQTPSQFLEAQNPNK